MTRTKTLLLLLAAVAVLVLAACGGDDDGASAASIKPMTTGGKAATVGVADNGDLGKILVDSKGRSVYLFQKDTGPKSTCFGGCAAEWPPVTTSGKPTAGDGLTSSKLATTKRSDGTTQVTYNGHPLYLYAGDQSAGDTSGQGLNFYGGLWYVLSPSGNANTGGGSGSGSGSKAGYSY